MKIVTARQMRDLDRKAIDDRGIPGLVLMENAGRAVAETAYRMTEYCPGRPIVVLCGRGNNGGDGFVAARHVFEMGRPVRVFLAASTDQVTGDARENLARLRSLGIELALVDSPKPVAESLAQAALVIDALLGTGLSGPVRGLSEELISAVNKSGRPVLAVDIPSGLDSDTGEPLGLAVRATETVTMGLPKLGLFLHPGVDYAGRVSVADIGFPGDLVADADAAADLSDAEWVRMLLPARPRSAHKGTFGTVLIVAGSVGMTGAAALCAEAAARIGAGLVFVGCPASLNDILEAKLTEPLTIPLPETYERSLDTRALAFILERAEKADVVAIGPGISHHPDTALLVRRLVARLDKPLVIDADGLNALAEVPALLEAPHAPAVLTPHPGEMGTMMGVPTSQVQGRRTDFAQAAAIRFRSVIILKGACSLIAESGRRLVVNPTGNPGMASGGTGDVLTGLIAGLIAQGLLPFDAAVAATYLHGLAGDLAARRLGEASLLAGDLVAALPQAVCHVVTGVGADEGI